MSAFSDKLSDLMRTHNLNDDKMADMFDVSRTTIVRWRNGERTPKLPKLIEIANRFNVSTNEFVEYDVRALNYLSNDETLSNSKTRTPIRKYGCVTAGTDGLALQEYLGYEFFDDISNPEDYFSLDVKGDSMTGDGIFENDVVLIRKTSEIEYNGQIGVVIINGDEGTLKHIYKDEDSISLHSSNPNYPPRVFVKDKCEDLIIAGVLKEMKRKFN